jgi:hypothetical protein
MLSKDHCHAERSEASGRRAQQRIVMLSAAKHLAADQERPYAMNFPLLKRFKQSDSFEPYLTRS